MIRDLCKLFTRDKGCYGTDAEIRHTFGGGSLRLFRCCFFFSQGKRRMYTCQWRCCSYRILIRDLILNGVNILMSAYWSLILYSFLIYQLMKLKSVVDLAWRDTRRVNCKPRCETSLWHWRIPLGRYAWRRILNEKSHLTITTSQMIDAKGSMDQVHNTMWNIVNQALEKPVETDLAFALWKWSLSLTDTAPVVDSVVSTSYTNALLSLSN